MDKKASMELGVNAIIILIIALAILGLAMSFVTGLFKGGQKKLGGLIDRTDLPVHADPTNPIVFDSNEVFIKTSGAGTATLIVSVYNNNFIEGAPVYLEIEGCVYTGEPYAQPFFTLTAPSQTISPGSDSGYKAIISVTPGMDIRAGTYICTVRATDGNTAISQQIFITATK